MNHRLSPLLILLLFACTGPSPWHEPAREAGVWLGAVGKPEQRGISWAAIPGKSRGKETSLYSGTPGVVLFFLEAYRQTGNKLYLAQALAGADFLQAHSQGGKKSGPLGLYDGLAGLAFTLNETWRTGGADRHRKGAQACLRQLLTKAIPSPTGSHWNNSHDIIGGGAGIGLFLIYAAREMDSPAALAMARRAGKHLLTVGQPAGEGRKWAMSPTYPRMMPNFSHGTAGICYFLACLHGQTGEAAFLEAAEAGGRYLLGVADKKGYILHHEPGGEELKYLGWCHGPPGTGRLYHQLWLVTKDRKWQGALTRAATSLLESGIPTCPQPGFWNNQGQCCGTAGVGQFFLDLYRARGQQKWLHGAREMAHHLRDGATRQGLGWKWLSAEHRVRPAQMVAQTGYMQGAAGIGLFMLQLAAVEEGKKPAIIFPDSPFH